MKVEFSEQYGCPCIVVDAGTPHDEVICYAYESEAVTYPEGPEDPHFVVKLPGRPQELYTTDALRRTLEV